MSQFMRGYKADAGVDIVLDRKLVIRPGFQAIELDASYTPHVGEVAIIVPRGSTAALGIFPITVLIDAGYTGKLTAWLFNASGVIHEFEKGDRVFGIVNLKLGEDRVKFDIVNSGERGDKKVASSGKSAKIGGYYGNKGL